jgi:hypothetical protein
MSRDCRVWPDATRASAVRKRVPADCQSIRAVRLSGDAVDRPADPRMMVLDTPQFATAFLVRRRSLLRRGNIDSTVKLSYLTQITDFNRPICPFDECKCCLFVSQRGYGPISWSPDDA